MELHPTELIILSGLNNDAFIKRIAKDFNYGEHLNQIYDVFKFKFPGIPLPIFKNKVRDEIYRQANIRHNRKNNKIKDKTKRDRLLNIAEALLYPPYMHFSGRKELGSYQDVRLIDKNVYAIAVSLDTLIKKKLVYKIGNYLKKHKIPKRLNTVAEALDWIEPLDVKCARHGSLDGRKVKKIVKVPEEKLFYIYVEGISRKQFSWIEQK